MKKILALLLAIVMIATFCACAQQSAETASTETARQIVQSVIVMGFDASTITQEDVDNYGFDPEPSFA